MSWFFLVLALGISVIGCRSSLQQSNPPMQPMDTVKGYIGVVVDTSLLLLWLEQRGGGTPQRILVAFNGQRYDPRTNGVATTPQKLSPESPFRGAYHVEMNLDSAHGFPMSINGRENLPTESTSERITVAVTSFPDPHGRLPMATVEEVVLKNGQPHSVSHQFEFTEGTWKPTELEGKHP